MQEYQLPVGVMVNGAKFEFREYGFGKIYCVPLYGLEGTLTLSPLAGLKIFLDIHDRGFAPPATSSTVPMGHFIVFSFLLLVL